MVFHYFSKHHKVEWLIVYLLDAYERTFLFELRVREAGQSHDVGQLEFALSHQSLKGFSDQLTGFFAVHVGHPNVHDDQSERSHQARATFVQSFHVHLHCYQSVSRRFDVNAVVLLKQVLHRDDVERCIIYHQHWRLALATFRGGLSTVDLVIFRTKWYW